MVNLSEDLRGTSIGRWWLLAVLMIYCMRLSAIGVGGSGMFQYSVELRNYISNETGKAPVAFLWLPDSADSLKGDENGKMKAVLLCQQNMTEEAIIKMPSFQKEMSRLGVAMIWVAPAFSNNWDPTTPCQTIFEDMMGDLADQSGHPEIAKVPVIPLGHSAQATFPWNFAAWNPNRTLCIISFHGDAPRTNLCGYGGANIEWGRHRNIDGIPGLMIEGEYEWWEARVNPALAFRMMYPESCISFLCDTGRGHFDCGERTATYIAKFIEKSLKWRLAADGSLKKVNPRDGWLAERFHPDMVGTDGADKGKRPVIVDSRPEPAPFSEYIGDKHDAFWYFDKEMAELTEARYTETAGKKLQYVGFECSGKIVPYDGKSQGGMRMEFQPMGKHGDEAITMRLKAVFTDSTHNVLSDAHGTKQPHIEVVDGPVKIVRTLADGTTFLRLYPYEAGWDNKRRSFNCWVVAVADADSEYKGAVQPVRIDLLAEVKEIK